MNHPSKIGLGFGVTSGLITTLGLIIGLNSTTHSSFVVIGGILTIAVADSLSDALGIHMSEETDRRHSEQAIFQSAIYTFVSKFILTISFVLPILLFPLSLAIVVSIIYGLIVLIVLSLVLAQWRQTPAGPFIFKHLVVAIGVILLSNYLGQLFNFYFKI